MAAVTGTHRGTDGRMPGPGANGGVQSAVAQSCHQGPGQLLNVLRRLDKQVWVSGNGCCCSVFHPSSVHPLNFFGASSAGVHRALLSPKQKGTRRPTGPLMWRRSAALRSWQISSPKSASSVLLNVRLNFCLAVVFFSDEEKFSFDCGESRLLPLKTTEEEN